MLILVLGCNPSKRKEPGQTLAKAGKVTIAEIESGIRSYIDRRTKEDGGYFNLIDDDRKFRMKLVRVHTEYLSNLGNKKYFACVDLAEEGGDVYDVDFFMEGEPGNMVVTETSVHKINGKPYYAWEQNSDKTWRRVPLKNATARLLGVIEGKDTFEFTYRVRLPAIEGAAKMWIPIATSDAHQTIAITRINVPGEPRWTKDKDYGNSILYTEFGPSEAGRTAEITYRVGRSEKSATVYAGAIPDRYLAPNTMVPVGGQFGELAQKVTAGLDGDLVRARALYDYVIENMRYMKYGNYGKGDAVHACDVRTGNCTEFHSLFISLARSAGIPSRFAVGASIPSERNEGGLEGYHCWAEFFAEGRWWPVDISEGNKYTALATYYFGHHPANRIEISRGRDLRLEPSPTKGPINFLVYPVLEVDGKDVPAQTDLSFQRIQVPAQ